MLMIALGRMRDPRATDVLIALLDDRDVGGHALLPLGRRRARQARAKIARFLDHEQASVRRDAKRALAMIDAATETC
jgi:HEAT repeat protein